MPDQVKQSVEIVAPVERVFRALSDAREFGAWFRVAFDAPFVAGQAAHGKLTEPGYEHLAMTIEIVAIEAPTRFAFRWHPYAIDPDMDYSSEPQTLVEFRLEPTGGGTRLTVTESGFDALPPGRRDEAFRMNDRGWATQLERIAAYAAPVRAG